LAGLPALLATRAVSPPVPAAVVEWVDESDGMTAMRAGWPAEVPASDEYRRAVAEHDDALTAYFLFSPSRHRARAVGDTGRRLLDLVEAQTGQPIAALTLTGAPTTEHPMPPEHWPRSQRVSAVRLQPGQLLLGHLDATTVHAFGEPERIEYVQATPPSPCTPTPAGPSSWTPTHPPTGCSPTPHPPTPTSSPAPGAS
jgi:hypothetical protein